MYFQLINDFFSKNSFMIYIVFFLSFLTFIFAINLRIWYFFKNNTDPLDALKPKRHWYLKKQEEEKLKKEIERKG